MKDLANKRCGLKSTQALAGNTDGGGAGALICQNDQTLLYDLWEGQQAGLLSKRGLQILTSNAAVSDQLASAVERLEQANPVLAAQVMEKLGVIDSALRRELKISVLPENIINQPSDETAIVAADAKSGRHISVPQDLATILIPNHCSRLTGVARWLDSKNTLYMDKDEYEKMAANTDRAALWIHEAVYRVLRANEDGWENSFTACFITANLFSTKEPSEYSFRGERFAVKVQQMNSAYVALNPFFGQVARNGAPA